MSTLQSTRRTLTAGLAALVLVAGMSVAEAAPAEAASKRCSASVSVTHPKQRTNTTVKISKIAPKVTVTTKAKYKTTTNTKHVKSSSKGTANVTYNVGGATPKRKVTVTVTAKKGKDTWSCSTSFTPQKR